MAATIFFVESTVQGTELINIEFYTKYFHFIDEVPVYCSKKKTISKQNISKVLASQWQVTELKNIDRDTRPLRSAWFAYDRWRSFAIAGIASKLLIVAIIWKQNFPCRLPKIVGIEPEYYLHDHNDRDGSSAIATI